MTSLPNKPITVRDREPAQKNGVPPDYAESSAGSGPGPGVSPFPKTSSSFPTNSGAHIRVKHQSQQKTQGQEVYPHSSTVSSSTFSNHHRQPVSRYGAPSESSHYHHPLPYYPGPTDLACFHPYSSPQYYQGPIYLQASARHAPPAPSGPAQHSFSANYAPAPTTINQPLPVRYTILQSSGRCDNPHHANATQDGAGNENSMQEAARIDESNSDKSDEFKWFIDKFQF